MRKLSICHWTAGLSLAVIAVFATACNGDQKEASATAKAFLQAYYVDLDFNKALQLSSDASQAAIREQAEVIALNPYAKEETPDLVLRGIEMDKKNSETAVFSYTCNRIKRQLPLRRFNGRWLIDLQGGTVETDGIANDFLLLSSGNEGGFASAASGEIKYKKRRQGNKQ